MAMERNSAASAPCAPCGRGPTGIAGHDALFSHNMGATHMHFRCRDCGSVWVRRYGAEGDFLWGPSGGEHPGMDTPGRPGTAPP